MSVELNGADAIYYRGEAFRARKMFWHGTHRIRPPAETLQLIRPYFAQAGITRLANITGLDRIGIPTVLSIRPNSPTLTTSAGKGFTIEAAMASAAMEGIELYHAENVTLNIIRKPYEQLETEHNIVALEDIPKNKNSRFDVAWPHRWVLGWDILNQDEVAVPLSIVDLVFSHGIQNDRVWNLNSFPVNSNGLASGNVFLEALAAGLYEVIERDGVTIHTEYEKLRGRPPPIVDLKKIQSPLVLDLIGRCLESGVTPMLFDCTVDTKVPIYRAYIYETSVRHHLGTFKGFGAHLDPAIAMIRALTEAIQGRLIYIAGSRDDIFRNLFSRIVERDTQAVVDWLQAHPSAVGAPTMTSAATDTFEGDVEIMVRNLATAGLRQVIVFDLTLPDWPISVVRVVVPGLEGYGGGGYAPGRRATEFEGTSAQ